MSQATTWQSRAKAKRLSLSASLPPEWRLQYIPSPEECPNVMLWPSKFLSEEELVITESQPLVILANIQASLWSAEEVTRAFCHRAAIAHQLVRCLTEIMFEEAICSARELDAYVMANGVTKGPLHGLPVSFMDRYRVSGVESAAGFVSWLGSKDIQSSESLVVRSMRQLGAIPFCKTNVPQSMMLGSTANNILGSTTNPSNRRLSAGGAAGGEGALLAMKGSPLGWATEVAGSARIPAAFNGVYALRVSAGRLPTQGIASLGRYPICRVTAAMMSWDLPTLRHVCRLTFGAQANQIDPEWLDIPWREHKVRTLQQHRPTFAVMHHDSHVHPQPPIARALNTIVDALRSQGYEVINWNPPPHSPAVENLFRIIGADGASEIRSQINASGEPPVEQLREWFFNQDTPPKLPTTDFWKLCQSRLDYLDAYHRYWLSTSKLTADGKPVTGVIMPVVPNAACLEGKLTYFGYSAVVNYLDFSAAAFPVTVVDSAEDIKQTDLVSLSSEDEATQTAYDPFVFHGAPVGLQVMCRRLEEEVALSLAEIITRALEGRFRKT